MAPVSTEPARGVKAAPALLALIRIAAAVIASVCGVLLTAVLWKAGVILGAIYMLWMFRRVFFGPMTHPENQKLSDLNRRELLILAPVIALIIIPPAAARFWTERLGTMAFLSALFGGLSGYLGAAPSLIALLDALFANAPVGLAFWDDELRYRRINARLADPRGLSDAEARKLTAEGKAVIIQSFGLHSSEVVERSCSYLR